MTNSKHTITRRNLVAGGLLLTGGAALSGCSDTSTANALRSVEDDLRNEIAKVAKSGKKRIAIGILGQSNEQNRVLPEDRERWPQAFQSLMNPSISAPQQGNIVSSTKGTGAGGQTKPSDPFGGMWFTLQDSLLEQGVESQIVNGAIGSASMRRDFAGSASFWKAGNTGYFAKRPPLGSHDAGYHGTYIIAGNPAKIFRCVKGRNAYATYDGVNPIDGTDLTVLDYILTTGKEVAGDVEPDWDSVENPGDRLNDGDIVWEYERDNNLGLNPANTGRNIAHFRLGPKFFDPYRLCLRLDNMMRSIGFVDEKWIIIQNGQSDYAGSGTSQLSYQIALQNLTQYFLDRGYKVAIGLSCYATTQETVSWDGLSAAREAALNLFKDDDRVVAGANLYQALGTDVAKYMQKDGVHLNGEGAIAAGQVWGEVFREILSAKADTSNA